MITHQSLTSDLYADALRGAELYDARYLIDLFERAWACQERLAVDLARHHGEQKWWEFDRETKASLERLRYGIATLTLILDEHPDVERVS